MKTNFQNFCENIAHKTLEIENDNKGFDITAILAFIETIATIIKTVTDMCPNKNQMVKIAKNPSWTQRVLFRAEARKAFSDSENWQIRRAGLKAANATLEQAAKMEEVELQKIVDELTLIDNGII